MKPEAPCLSCKSRYLGCHSACKYYLAYKKELDEFNSRRRKHHDDEDIYLAYMQNKSKKKSSH